MFEFEACEVLKVKEFTKVNDCFQHERNEEIGHYGQTLFSPIIADAAMSFSSVSVIRMYYSLEFNNLNDYVFNS